MAEHPIQGLMRSTLESLKEMIDVNTVVGDAVETPDGQVIIPISRVSVGFAAGGSEFGGRTGGRNQGYEYEDEQDGGQGGGNGGGGMPFGGGSGAGISVQPVGFLVVGKDIRLLPVDQRQGWEKLVDLAPQIVDRLGTRAGGQGERGGQGRHPQQQEPGGGEGGGENGVRRRGRQGGDRLARRVVDAMGEEGEEDY